MSDNQALEQRVQELEIRLEAASRVLFRLISWQRNFNESLLGHLFVKKVGKKAVTDRANDMEALLRDRPDYYMNFAAAVLKEIEKMEGNKNER
ncbi:MAG: hypothetical protein Q4F00_14290 [bacterium]|nr:hypothetical protein [bacterium]